MTFRQAVDNLYDELDRQEKRHKKEQIKNAILFGLGGALVCFSACTIKAALSSDDSSEDEETTAGTCEVTFDFD